MPPFKNFPLSFYKIEGNLNNYTRNIEALQSNKQAKGFKRLFEKRFGIIPSQCSVIGRVEWQEDWESDPSRTFRKLGVNLPRQIIRFSQNQPIFTVGNDIIELIDLG